LITIEIGRGRGSLRVQMLGLLQSETGRGIEEGEGGREGGQRREEAEAGGEGYVAIGAGGEQEGGGQPRGPHVYGVVRLSRK